MELTQEDDEEKGLTFRCKEVRINLKNLGYSVRQKKGSYSSCKHILQNINAEFKSGRLSAILGPSGAGKTSLLNILSGFRTSNVTGSITLNGERQNLKELRLLSSYIPQEFDMHPLLTTRETLSIAASLKLSTKIVSKKKTEMVNQIMELLWLRKVENNYVGKLSGGEKKRLSIGIELLTNPPIMLFDEPTSGLDSSSSYQVITHLKSLAQNGRIIICSIHQPSSRLFEMFDDAVLLSEKQCYYSGPISDMANILEEAGFLCPRFYNLADFAIEVVSNERGDSTNLLKVFQNNAEATVPNTDDDTSTENSSRNSSKSINKFCKNFKKIAFQPIVKTSLGNKDRYPVGFHMQFFILLRRAFLCVMRDLHMAWLRMAAHILVALLLGVMYYDMGNEASKTTSNVACIFFFIMFLYFSNAMPTILTFPIEAAVFQREYLNNWYSLAAYYSSKLVAELPLQVLCPTLFICSGYFLTSLPYDGVRLIQFWILCLLVTILGQTMGLAIGAAFDTKLGIFLVPATSIPMILFSGFFMKLQDFPRYLEWFSYISFFRFAFEGAMLCVYGYRRKDLMCSTIFCYFKSPFKILEEFGMENSKYEYDLIGLLVWIVGLQIALLVALKIKTMVS